MSSRAPLHRIVLGDNLEVLPTLPEGFARLVYIDPPFNTGRVQRRDRMTVRRSDPGEAPSARAAKRGDAEGLSDVRAPLKKKPRRATTRAASAPAEPDGKKPKKRTTKKGAARGVAEAVVARRPPERGGFGGHRYEVARVASGAYGDDFDDYEAFLLPRIELALRCMTPDGSLFVHLDAREVHYVKVALDRLLGRASFMNEIVWAYDYGARSKRRWPAKHDTILWYARNPDDYVFEFDAMDRIPYLAPTLVTKEKAKRGKTPTDVWWHTIVPTNGREKTGYPTQKPLGILNRIVKVHSRAGDVVLDFFAGSGTTGEAAARHGRGFVLVDENEEAVRIAASRLAFTDPECVGFTR